MLDWLKKQVKGVGNFLGVGPEHKLGGQRVQQTPPPRASAPPLLTPQFRVKLSDLGQRPQISGVSQPQPRPNPLKPLTDIGGEALKIRRDVVRGVADFAADNTFRTVTRAGARSRLTSENRDSYKPTTGVEKFFLGDEEIQSGQKLDKRLQGKGINVPGGPFAVAGLASAADVATRAKPVKMGLTALAAKGPHALQSTGKLLETRYGAEGKKAADKVKAARDEHEILSASLRGMVKTKLNRKEFEEAVGVVQGGKKSANPKVTQASKEMRLALDEAYSEAKRAGLDVTYLKSFFPHEIKKGTFKRGTSEFNQAVDHLLSTGRAKSIAEAESKVLSLKGGVSADASYRKRVSSNLELQRNLDLPTYKKTQAALETYLDDVARRVGETRHFGKTDGSLNALLRRIEKKGGDARDARELIELATGDHTLNKATRGLLKYQSFKLGTSALGNVTQSGNTAATTGILNTAKAAGKRFFSKEDKRFAEEAGVSNPQALRTLREQGAGIVGRIPGAIAAPAFNAVESTNRKIAAIAGRDFARKVAKKGDTRKLEKLGFTSEESSKIARAGKLTRDQELKAARSVVERTQFKTDAIDLPPWMLKDAGRIGTQFKTFQFKQAGYVKNELLGEAKKGNLAPLLRYSATTLPTGKGIGKIKGVVSLQSKQDEEDRRAGRSDLGNLIDDASNAGGIGLWADAYNLVNPNKTYNKTTDDKIVNALGIAGGVSARSAANVVKGGIKLGQGDWEGAARQGLKEASTATKVFERALPDQPNKFTAGKDKQKVATVEQLESQLKKAELDNGFFGFGGPTDQEREANVTRLKGQITEAKFNAEKDPVKRLELARAGVREKGGLREVDDKLVVKNNETGEVWSVDLTPKGDKGRVVTADQSEKSKKDLWKLWNNESLGNEDYDKYLKRVGVDTPEKKEALEIDVINDDNETLGGFKTRATYFFQRYKTAKPEERDAFLEKMLKNKILTQNVPAKMLELGLVTEDEANFLKNVWKNWDKYKKVWGTGKGGGSGASSGVGGKGRKAAKVSIPDVKAPAKSTIKTDVPEMTPMKANKERLAPRIGGVSAPSNRVSVKLGRPSKQRKSNKKLRFR